LIISKTPTEADALVTKNQACDLVNNHYLQMWLIDGYVRAANLLSGKLGNLLLDEAHNATFGSVNGMVLAGSGARAGCHTGTALTNDNGSANHILTAKQFNAEALSR
jgi:hypothetical protein